MQSGHGGHDTPFLPTAGGFAISRDLDPKRRARELSKAKQILIDFTESREREKMRSSSLTSLIDDANAALTDAFPDSTASFVNAQKLAHGGLLLELGSLESVGLFDQPQAKNAFLGKLGTSATIRPRQYNVIVYFIPLTFNAGDPAGMREVEAFNGLPPNSIVSTRWIKPANRRSPHQLVAHAVFSFADPKTANKVLAEQITVCHKKLDTVKSKREPIRCMKCQLWGHLAVSCTASHDKCGTCGEQHRSSDCNSPGLFCTPCGVDGHPSWDRECPTFNAKCKEMDQRTPDNQLVYFPTDEPWTHKTVESPWNFFSSLDARRQPPGTSPHLAPSSRPLIERIAPHAHPPGHSRRRTGPRGAMAHRDPSLPTADTVTPSGPSPQANLQRSSSNSLPVSSSNNHPDANIRASGRGKSRNLSTGVPHLVQRRLDEFRYQPLSQTPGAGPSRVSSLSQDITDLIHPSPNTFAPLAPPDLDDPPPDTQVLPPSSDPPLSPVPSQPRDYPVVLSPIQSWDAPLPPSRSLSPVGCADDSETNISFSSNA